MTWQYIAGFFDGEGTVRFTNQGGLAITIAQSRDRGADVLRKMCHFLSTQGIKSRQYKPYRQNMHTLGLTDRPHVLAFLRGVFPHTEVKRIEVQDHLRFTQLYPRMEPGTLARQTLSRETVEKRCTSRAAKRLSRS